MTGSLLFISPGFCTTVQDIGRPGHQRFGIPPSGALDLVSLRIANHLVGNEPDCAALEIAYSGPTFVVEADSARIAVAGGCAQIEIFSGSEGEPPRIFKTLESLRLVRGQTARVGAVGGASILYLAVEGGFAIAPVLGSRATYLRGGIGGFEGRALLAGDRLPLCLAEAPDRTEQRFVGDIGGPETVFRIIPGPQVDWFSQDSLRKLCDSEYTVGPASDRMGLRLVGPPIPHLNGYDIVSDVTSPGSIQIPGSQTPIILLADRQTTGGYPKIATVISADLPGLGRRPIGSQLRFALVTQEEALEARRVLLARLNGLTAQLQPAAPDPLALSRALLSENIVSGVHNPFY